MSVPALNAIFDELSKIYEKICVQSSLLSLSGADAVFGADGDKAAIGIVFDNVDTPAVPAIEALIGVQFIDFQAWLTDLIANAPLPAPPIPPPSRDCEILKACDQVSVINNKLASLNNVVFRPDELSQKVSEVLADIKGSLRSYVFDNEVAFTAPKIWDNKGKLNVNPDTAKFSFRNTSNDPGIDDIEEEVNDFYQSLLSAFNKAMIKDPPVT